MRQWRGNSKLLTQVAIRLVRVVLSVISQQKSVGVNRATWWPMAVVWVLTRVFPHWVSILPCLFFCCVPCAWFCLVPVLSRPSTARPSSQASLCRSNADCLRGAICRGGVCTCPLHLVMKNGACVSAVVAEGKRRRKLLFRLCPFSFSRTFEGTL